jgi:hypothetical protein
MTTVTRKTVRNIDEVERLKANFKARGLDVEVVLRKDGRWTVRGVNIAAYLDNSVELGTPYNRLGPIPAANCMTCDAGLDEAHHPDCGE